MIYCSGWGRKMAQAEFSGAIAAVAILLMAGSALAANEDYFNQEPVVHTWAYKFDKAA